jgi:hypothetical protein
MFTIRILVAFQTLSLPDGVYGAGARHTDARTVLAEYGVVLPDGILPEKGRSLEQYLTWYAGLGERTGERAAFLHDVFVAALEGGIGYWSECYHYHWSADDGATSDVLGFHAIVKDTEGEGVYVISAATIEKGIAAILDGTAPVHPEIRAWVADDNEDNQGRIDATAADAVIQAGLLGEVVYG